jgi:hypothetical protein
MQKFLNNNWKIISLILSWRVSLLMLGALAGYFLNYTPSFPYADTLLENYNLHLWLVSWANFDGVHYLTLANHGYLFADLTQAFFPLYPMLVSFLAKIFNLSTFWSGMLVSHLSFGFFVYFLVKIAKLEKLSPLLLLAVLLAFPTSFYFGAVYTESLFLSLVLGSFYFARIKNWRLAIILAILASATRITGVFLVPALMLEALIQTKNNELIKNYLWGLMTDFRSNFQKLFSLLQKQWRLLTFILLGASGLLAYMLYLYLEFGDPLYFFTVQSQFGSGRSSSLITYPQVVWRSLKILLTTDLSWRYWTYLQEFLVGVIGFVAIIWSTKYIRLSYVLFSLLAFLLPPLTGNFSSMPRYVLASISIFFLIAHILGKSSKNKLHTYLYFIISLIILAINTMLFIQGYWVS